MFIINVTKSFTCGENFNKRYYFFQVQFLKIIFFSGSVFEKKFFFQVQFLRIRLLSRSATMKT